MFNNLEGIEFFVIQKNLQLTLIYPLAMNQ